MEFDPFPPCLPPEEAEPELLFSPPPPSREALGAVELPAFVGLVWDWVPGPDCAFAFKVEAAFEFAPEAFLDRVPLVDRASLLPLVGAGSLAGLRRVFFGACFVCLLCFAGASVFLG